MDCQYCGSKAEEVKGDIIYPHIKSLVGKNFYLCRRCWAYVGCHPGTVTPLGSLANRELREARKQAHYSFDYIWKSGIRTRSMAYKFVAKKMGIDVKDCHIGNFDLAQCFMVVEIADEIMEER